MVDANVAGSHVPRQDVLKKEKPESRSLVSGESGSNYGKTSSVSQTDVHFSGLGLGPSYKTLKIRWPAETGT